MSGRLRRLDTGLDTARRNVALTAALVELHREGRIPDTLRLHRYPRAVLLGRHESLAAAVDRAQCEADGVELARRVSGGGAVYMAPCALAWDLVVAHRRLGATPEAAGEAVCTAVARGLSPLGIDARFRPLNEVAVGGRKLCGAGGYVDGPSFVLQGTILIDTDLAEMGRYLRASRSGALATLAALLGRAVPATTVATAIAEGIGDLLGGLRDDALTAGERTLADALHAAEIGRDAFVLGDDVQAAA